MLLVSLQLLIVKVDIDQLGIYICGDVIAKYMKGVFDNQLATNVHMTPVPHLCLSSLLDAPVV